MTYGCDQDNGSLFLKQRRHCTAESAAGFVVDLSVVVEVVALMDCRLIDIAPQVAHVNRLHVAFELGILAHVVQGGQQIKSVLGGIVAKFSTDHCSES